MADELTLEQELEQAQKEFQEEMTAAQNPPAEDEKPAEAVVEPIKTEEPEKFQMSDDDLVDPALSVLDRLGAERRREIIQKRWGEDLTPKKEIAQAMDDTARGAEKKAFADIVQELYDGSSPAVKASLPSDFDQLDGGTQFTLLKDATVEDRATKIADARVAPILSAEEERAYAKWVDESSMGVAQGFGAPDAAPKVKAFVSGLSKEEVAFYFQQKQNGGGQYVNMLESQLKGIVDAHVQEAQASKEIPLPKSEETGGGGDDDMPSLKGDAKKMYDAAKASGFYNEKEMRQFAKELASA